MAAVNYQTCSHRNAATNAPCLNEGWLFCTLCHRHYCDDHACIHTAQQVDKDNPVELDAERSDLDRETITFFRELSDSDLADRPEIQLRIYCRRLIAEARRVQREIERRMIHNPSYTATVLKRAREREKLAADAKAARLANTPDDPVTIAAREAKQAIKAAKQQQAIASAVKILQQQAKLGNLKAVDLSKLGQK